MSKIICKTRFCPSPTGIMHLGNLRTALFNALLARKLGGKFLLRIEDTDRCRSDSKYTETIFEDLRWLGMDWDEGPEYQSKRQPIYDEYYEKLIEKNRAYHCFCSEKELAISRKVQLAAGKPPRYNGCCAKLTVDEVQAKLAKGLKPALRFRVPRAEVVAFTDLVKGAQKFASDDLGDFIIRRADGTAPFMFCNGIDDALMGVTYALRGEDHLTNTPRQLLILRALGLPEPQYGHISLIMSARGGLLSKRSGSRSVQELRKGGYLPEAIINYMARLGHYYRDDEFMSFQGLVEKFSCDALGSAPAKFDEAQLLRWQQQAVEQLSSEQLIAWCESELAAVPTKERELFVETVRANITFPHDVVTWVAAFYQDLQLNDTTKAVLKQAGKEFFTVAAEAIEQHGTDFKAVSKLLQSKLGVKGKALFQPLRIALTGKEHGPELVKIFTLLGKKQLLKRISSI